MPHVVTQACCADASCVHACPVNCIHPTPDEPDFGMADMLYIDPQVCVDCGACVSACPVSAIVPHGRLAPEEVQFQDINADLAANAREQRVGRLRPQAPVPTLVRLSPTRHTHRIAIVGAGPAALYAADELLKQEGVEVSVFDKLSVPHGLARFGVAPDHERTRSINSLFSAIERQPGFRYRLGVEIGATVSAEEVAAYHTGVIYATGASADRPLDIPGIELPGSTSATEVVAWYNGHPERADSDIPLGHERAVIVGNGNVALDVARMLATEPEALESTDIAPTALATLAASRVREVQVLGRRGPEHAAFTLPELLGLAAREDIDLRVDAPEPIDPAAASDDQSRLALEALAEIAAREPREGRRRIVLRFNCAPKAVVGVHKAEGLRVSRTRVEEDADGAARVMPVTGTDDVIPAGLVLRSVGYRGVPVPGVPFDEGTATIPSRDGRVLGAAGGEEVRGIYTVGWIKRGPRGFIGSNKTCARETVNSLLSDLNSGVLPTPKPAREFEVLLADRGADSSLSAFA